MSYAKLTDGRVLHFPGPNAIVDSISAISAPADDALADLVPLIRDDDLLLFTKRLIDGARKRRRQPRYADVNVARLRLAQLCIERALENWPAIQMRADEPEGSEP